MYSLAATEKFQAVATRFLQPSSPRNVCLDTDWSLYFWEPNIVSAACLVRTA